MSIDHLEEATALGVPAVVLLSGGIDSMAATHYCVNRGWATGGVFVDFGQRAAVRESAAVKAIASYLRIDVRMCRATGIEVPDSGEVRGRNAWLIQTALMASHMQSGLVVTGIHGGTTYLDCSPDFIEKMADLVVVQTAGTIQLFTPFLRWNKADIWAYCHRESLPIDLTYSCERGLDQPCGGCQSCGDLKALRARS
jgi:7-cyano-7-deazaguanine synthase